MRQFITSIFFFLILLILIGGSVYGVVTPETNPVKTVGVAQIAAFKNGVALFQGNRQFYYTFSPFNDYYANYEGTRNTLITQDELNNKRYTTNLKTSRLTDILLAIQSYFGIPNPSVTFYTDKEITYDTLVENNQVTVIRTIDFKKSENITRLGITLSFSGFDMVYDKSGNLYTYRSDEDLALFQQLYGVTLIPKLDEFYAEVPDKTVVIVNPLLSAALVVRTSDNQRLFVNRNGKLIEVEENVSPEENYTSTVRVEVYENPREAQKSL